MNNAKPLALQDKWLLIIGIPFLGIVMPFVFNGLCFSFLFSEGYHNLLMSLFTTIVTWLGIRKIVILLWRVYPWEIHPVKHLVYEIILVFAYVGLVGFSTYVIFINTGFINYNENIPLVVSIALTYLVTFFITSLHEAWFFYKQWNISLLKAKTLEKENLQSQFETLKGQINPHFLFNTLNTMVSLIEEKPRVAVNYVQKTADFLRIILSLKDREVISLAEEINIIELFNQLQQERYGNNLRLKVDVPEKYHSSNIAPLSLQMLVENAIKHNVISSDKPLYIDVFIRNEKFISVRNNLQKKLRNQHNSNGIGLINIMNRYQFLSDQKVEITETDAMYEVALPLLRLQA